jgi:hypothetical protein
VVEPGINGGNITTISVQGLMCANMKCTQPGGISDGDCLITWQSYQRIFPFTESDMHVCTLLLKVERRESSTDI